MSALKLVTERANHQALKAVLTALSVKSPLTVTIATTSTTPHLLAPELKKPLFSCNEIARYLGEGDSQLSLADEEWLDWEATSFTASVQPLYSQKKVTAAVLEVFQHLNKSLEENSFPDQTTFVRFVIWSAVLPALCDGGLLPDTAKSSVPKLVEWFESFMKEREQLISEAFAALSVQEPADFLRVPQVFRMSPMNPKPFYVTTPIYYVNAAPHIGHVFSTLVADCVARYHRVKGEDVYFMTGTDEHGQKVAQAAEKKGKTPFDFCTDVSNEFKDCFKTMRFDNDYFIRTTDATHEAVVQELWTKLEAEGDIFLGKYEGWYCLSDEAYVTQQYVTDGVDREGKPCKISTESKNPVTWVAEDNYMFRLSAFRDRLLHWYRSNPGCIVPEFRRREMINFVEKGLNDLSISRKKESCSWGIPIPGTDKHVVYVWLDALSNYYTASRIKDGGLVDYESLHRWPADLHVIGKDILKFHTVYWPAFLMSAGLPLPKRIVAHGWWTKDGEKISKSLGNSFDPVEKANQFGYDALKYFLLRESSFADDGDFSDAKLIARLNSELADTLGNLVMRCTSRKVNMDGVWTLIGETNERDLALIQTISELPGTADHYYNIPDVQRALMSIFDVLRTLNGYMTESAPWKLAKENVERLRTVLYIIMEGVRICTILISPVLRDSAPKILDQLGVPSELRVGVSSMQFGAMPAGAPLPPPTEEILFAKVITDAAPPAKNPKGKKN
ncbi:methionyl-tRNA synthetase, putative [Bodo saltans]|uniref:methionine--tRNA ligase n=1 Tax=Bodo saltans TaxID=75058 RepID=A0A0S4J699_BODSA|nr:methionyl-tRNA synthetase, putative [Bodo saltans]|eukprot:CUG85473.1 methionyl-tRNA synthetase, putative [Bodo saltans]